MREKLERQTLTAPGGGIGKFLFTPTPPTGEVLVRSASEVARGNTGANTLINKPSGTQDGDLMVIFFEAFGQDAVVPASPPAGFVSLPTFPRTRSDVANFKADSYIWVKAASGEGASFTVTHAAASKTAVMCSLVGANLLNPFSVTPQFANGTDNPATAPSITSVFDKSMCLLFMSAWDFMGAANFPAGFTIRNDVSVTGLAMGTKQLSPQGATGNQVTSNIALGPWLTGLIVVDPA